MSDKLFSVHRYEAEALVAWHRDQEYRSASKGQYLDADDHKKRREDLERLLAPVADFEKAWSGQ